MAIYKYPELLRPLNLADLSTTNAEYNTLVPALGFMILQHVLIRLQNRFSFSTDGYQAIKDAQYIIVVAKDKCTDDYYAAMKEYSKL